MYHIFYEVSNLLRKLNSALRSIKMNPLRPVLFRNSSFYCTRGFSFDGSGFNFIDGRRTSPIDSKGFIEVLEPASGRALCSIQSSGSAEVHKAVENGRKAFSEWSQLSGLERGKILISLSQKMNEKLEDLACLEVEDNGKPISEARADVAASANCFAFFGGIASTVQGKHIPLSNGSFGLIKREPLGVVGGIGAWNYPILTCAWKAAPALACGNAFIYKPSELTPLSALALAELGLEVGLPAGVFNVIQGGAETGSLLCLHPRVAKISFTGSVSTGKHIMELASKDVKRVTLELGGKSPLIIFDDCHITNAVKGALMANFYSQGQVCSNGTRIFVQRSIADLFADRLAAAARKLKIGDPLSDDTQVGATITRAHAQNVLAYVEGAVREGATVLCGGERVAQPGRLAPGYFLSPCVLTNCHDQMTAVQEEIFGPVATILPFDDEDEVIRRANDTPYGLSAGIFTRDLQRAHRVSDRLECGNVWINTYNLSPVELPFGGYKWSGIGRECSTEAIQYYTQSKSVYFEMNDIQCSLYNE